MIISSLLLSLNNWYFKTSSDLLINHAFIYTKHRSLYTDVYLGGLPLLEDMHLLLFTLCSCCMIEVAFHSKANMLFFLKTISNQSIYSKFRWQKTESIVYYQWSHFGAYLLPPSLSILLILGYCVRGEEWEGLPVHMITVIDCSHLIGGWRCRLLIIARYWELC